MFNGWIHGSVVIAQSMAVFLTVATVVMGGLLYKFQRKLVYPSAFPPNSRTQVDVPSKWHMTDFEDLKIPSKDGTLLHCYLIWNKKSESSPPARKTLLFLQPNAGNMVSYIVYFTFVISGSSTADSLHL